MSSSFSPQQHVHGAGHGQSVYDCSSDNVTEFDVQSLSVSVCEPFTKPVELSAASFGPAQDIVVWEVQARTIFETILGKLPQETPILYAKHIIANLRQRSGTHEEVETPRNILSKDHREPKWKQNSALVSGKEMQGIQEKLAFLNVITSSGGSTIHSLRAGLSEVRSRSTIATYLVTFSESQRRAAELPMVRMARSFQLVTATFIPSPFTSHTPLYTRLDLLSDADSEERKDLATSQSADDPVPVEVSAESISENDPASSPLATSADYAMTQTLGRTGVAIYRGDDGIQFNSRPSSVLAPTNVKNARWIPLRYPVT
ncbi:hypothetical protein BGY98DRAFT_933810 [Russula aff. rugulosa BPL654]|nr:hypothetical protein BGY98DRAFT_933810 [Russula aff. rugulosa BPL654]